MTTLFTIEEQDSTSNNPMVFGNTGELMNAIGMSALAKVVTIDIPTKRLVNSGFTLEQVKKMQSECADLKNTSEKKAAECEQKATECQDLKTKCEKLGNECQDLKTKCENLGNECENLKTKCKTLENECQDLKNNLKKATNDWELQKSIANQLESKLSDYTEVINNVHKISTRYSLHGDSSAQSLINPLGERVEEEEERAQVHDTNKRTGTRNATGTKRRRNN
jgi:predicted RNase H-like nuclease (RuvC/YqgF family)